MITFKNLEVTYQIDGKEVKKRIEFEGTGSIEYYLGWNRVLTLKREREGLIPKTPLTIRTTNDRIIRLYTPKMREEMVDLIDIHYPVLYKGRDVILKANYYDELNEYREKVKQLEEKWKDVSYLIEAEEAVDPNIAKKKFFRRKK